MGVLANMVAKASRNIRSQRSVRIHICVANTAVVRVSLDSVGIPVRPMGPGTMLTRSCLRPSRSPCLGFKILKSKRGWKWDWNWRVPFCQCCRPKYFQLLGELEIESLSGKLKVVVPVLFWDISVSTWVDQELKVMVWLSFLDISVSTWVNQKLKVVVWLLFFWYFIFK